MEWNMSKSSHTPLSGPDGNSYRSWLACSPASRPLVLSAPSRSHATKTRHGTECRHTVSNSTL